MSACLETDRLVSIAGWDNQRRLIVEDEKVILEVARTANNCHRCPTCQSHVDHIEQFLQGGSYVWQWQEFDGGKWIAICRDTDQESIAFLAEATGLKINGIKPSRLQADCQQGTTKLSPDHKVVRVHVSHWRNVRDLIVEPRRILFQVTLTCRHCETCASRVSTMHSILDNSSIPHRWEYLEKRGDRRWVSFPRRPDQDPVELLQELTDLGISRL